MKVSLRAAVVALALVTACGSKPDDALTRALEAHADGDLEEASELYRDVLEDDPSNKFAHYNIGLIHQTAGRNDSAAAAYRKSLETDPRFVPAMFNLAVLLTKPQPREAIELYRQIFEIQPRYASAHLNLGFLLKENGEEAEGNAELKKAVQLDPELKSRIPSSPRPQGRATPGP